MILFISHASEDKGEFVRPLAAALQEYHTVWFDEYELTIGDSLLQKIDDGLKKCDFAVVVLSPAFFAKKWPRAELDGLFALETTERKIILPVWRNVTEEDIKAFSPILAGKMAARADEGIPRVVAAINRSVDVATRVASFSEFDSLKQRLRGMKNQLDTERRSRELLDTRKGAELAFSAAQAGFGHLQEEIRKCVAETGFALEAKLFQPMAFHSHLSVNAPFGYTLSLYYRSATNNAEGAAMHVILRREKRDFFGNEEINIKLKEHDFKPFLDEGGNISWVRDDKRLTNSQLGTFALGLLVSELETLVKKEGK